MTSTYRVPGTSTVSADRGVAPQNDTGPDLRMVVKPTALAQDRAADDALGIDERVAPHRWSVQ